MRKLMIGALPLMLLGGAAWAGPSCDTGGSLKPMWEIAKSFEETGGTIQTLKTSDGCYEIYGRQGDEKVEIYYDPRTGAELERE
jgi:hypothetical protein